MNRFRRKAPPHGRLAVWLTAAALATAAWPSLAQTPNEALSAAHPDTASKPFTSAMPWTAPEPPVNNAAPPSAAQALQRWRAANDRVGAFPRGHIDILKWEARQAPPALAPKVSGTALLASDALRASLRIHPDLWSDPSDNAAAQRQRARAWAQHLADNQRVWVQAVVSQALLRDQQARSQLSDDAVELGRRMVDAGNWSQARLLSEQLAQARELSALGQARQSALEAREALARWMGMWSASEVEALPTRLPAQLPSLPGQIMLSDGLAPDTIEAAVLRAQAPLQAQREAVERGLRAADPRSWSAWQQGMEAALQSFPADAPRPPPPLLTDARLRNAHGLPDLAEAQADLLRSASQQRSTARLAWARVQRSFEAAQLAQNTVLPLQTALEQETLLRYNGMLQSTWELIDASRARLQAASDATQAVGEFWLAQAQWDALLAGAEFKLEPIAPGASTATPSTSAAGH